MKVVFLDIDGVLNDHARLIKLYCGINHDCVKRLNRITDATDAKIIISSAWRYMIYCGEMTIRGFEYLLVTHGVSGELIGITKSDEEIPRREDQIKSAIDTLGIDKYVVLDDLPLEIDNFVQTDGKVGLTDKDVERAIAILSS